MGFADKLSNITEAKWYKTMMPKLYGWGASLVIIGALFKIENWPFASVFLTIGLYNMFKSPQSNIRGGNQIIFSDFLKAVDNGEVLKVEIQGKNIKGV